MEAPLVQPAVQAPEVKLQQPVPLVPSSLPTSKILKQRILTDNRRCWKSTESNEDLKKDLKDDHVELVGY